MSSTLQTTHRAWTVLWAFVIGVVIGLAVESVFCAVAVRLHPDGATLAADFSWMVRQCFYMFPVLMTGLVVTRVLNFRAPTFLIAMFGVQGLLIVRAEVFAPSQAVPPSLWALTLLVAPLPVILAGWIQIPPRESPGNSTRGIPVRLGPAASSRMHRNAAGWQVVD